MCPDDKEDLMVTGKRFVCFIGFVFLLGAGGLLHPFFATAGPDDSTVTFFIETEQIHDSDAGISPVTTWRLEIKQASGFSTRISFFTDAAAREIGHLIVYPDGRVESSPEIGQLNIFQDRGLFLAPGFSAPCNILPVADLAVSCPSVMVKTIEKTIGDQRFASQIELRCDPVDIEECVTQGWVRDGKNIREPLKMISAFNQRTRKLMVRQLWHEKDDWWLYEETEFQKSWRATTGN